MKTIRSSPSGSWQAQQVRVLIVDDEKDFAKGLKRLLSSHFSDIEVTAVDSAKAALKRLVDNNIHLMITDLRMPEMNGMQLLEKALALQPELSMVVLSAYGSIETAVQALQLGAYDFLTKPIDPEQLFRVVEKGLERSRLIAENSRLRRIISQGDIRDEFIGEGPAIQQVRRTIAAIVQSNYPVLIRGESGTGKEVVARLIHRMGERSTGPFLSIDCPSIPENLLESELFGYVKGAFTGAERDHRGLFSAADGGIIHLDEIGDIHPAVQTKLLRCLENSEVRPIGSNKSYHVDVRVISSTNKNLEEALQNKSFREDLYYRLNVLSVTLPPLRDRVEDIPLLALHFQKEICLETNVSEKEMAPEVLQWMMEREWPGNVRELQNFVRRLMVFCRGERIGMELVQTVLDGFQKQPKAQRDTPTITLPDIISYKEAKQGVLDSFTRRYIKDLLQFTKGNISEGARISGISRVALQKILIRLGEDAAIFRE